MTEADRHRAVVDVAFASPRRDRLPVDVLDRQALFATYGRDTFARDERLTFGLMIIGTSGTGWHVVDGDPVQLDRGVVITVLPGQVHRHVPDGQAQAVLVLWRGEVAPLGLPLTTGSTGTVFRARGPSLDALLGLAAELDREVQAFDGSASSTRAATSLLEALLWRVQRVAEQAGALGLSTHPQPVYDAFRDLLERRVDSRPTVAGLARELGWSPRTLTRACRAATGRSVKELIDERVALEARRLLLHTPLTVAAVGRRLGWTDAVRFGAWFRRIVGVPPGVFRHERAVGVLARHP